MKGPIDRKEMLGKRDIIYSSRRFKKMDDPGVGSSFWSILSISSDGVEVDITENILKKLQSSVQVYMFNESIKWERGDRCTNRRCWLKCGNDDTNERYGVISDALVPEADYIDGCNENPKI